MLDRIRCPVSFLACAALQEHQARSPERASDQELRVAFPMYDSTWPRPRPWPLPLRPHRSVRSATGQLDRFSFSLFGLGFGSSQSTLFPFAKTTLSLLPPFELLQINDSGGECTLPFWPNKWEALVSVIYGLSTPALLPTASESPKFPSPPLSPSRRLSLSPSLHQGCP
jgi:hypothetical protein